VCWATGLVLGPGKPLKLPQEGLLPGLLLSLLNGVVLQPL
jgi:hypothetical protein